MLSLESWNALHNRYACFGLEPNLVHLLNDGPLGKLTDLVLEDVLHVGNLCNEQVSLKYSNKYKLKTQFSYQLLQNPRLFGPHFNIKSSKIYLKWMQYYFSGADK